MIKPRARDSFWKAVEDCLVQFHGPGKPEAHAQASELRMRIEQPPPGISNEIFHHNEPFDVACRITNSDLDLSQHFSEYDGILTRHNW